KRNAFLTNKRKTGPHVMRFRKQRVSPVILFESLTKPVPRVPFANYTANATGHKDKVKQLLPFLRIGHGISNRPLSESPNSGLAGSFLDTESTSLGRPRHPSVRNVGHLGKSTYLAMLLLMNESDRTGSLRRVRGRPVLKHKAFTQIGAAPETLKDRTIKYRRKHQTRPIIECMRNGRTVMSCSVGELKVKGQKDEQELVIQEALASQLDI
ncbi:hypothetical protein Lal_00015590, partial [Lupinus albus]